MKILGEDIHVRVSNSIDKRKLILESALLSNSLLQKYEDIKAVRNEKTKQMALFKKTMKEIILLFKELEFKELPEIKIPKEETFKRTKKEIMEEKPVSRTKLESDLDNIRNKLENLKI